MGPLGLLNWMRRHSNEFFNAQINQSRTSFQGGMIANEIKEIYYITRLEDKQISEPQLGSQTQDRKWTKIGHEQDQFKVVPLDEACQSLEN